MRQRDFGKVRGILVGLALLVPAVFFGSPSVAAAEEIPDYVVALAGSGPEGVLLRLALEYLPPEVKEQATEVILQNAQLVLADPAFLAEAPARFGKALAAADLEMVDLGSVDFESVRASLGRSLSEALARAPGVWRRTKSVAVREAPGVWSKTKAALTWAAGEARDIMGQ